MEKEYQSILPVVRSYKANCLESQKILAEVRKYRQQYKPRLDQLKQEKEGLEKVILEFMDKFRHPGIRDQDTTIMRLEKKPKQSLAVKTSEVGEVLNRYHVASDVQKEVIETLKDNKAKGRPSLKMKISRSS